MPLAFKLESEVDNVPRLTCISHESGGTSPICEGTDFEIWNDPDRGVVAYCNDCGEEYELSYIVEVSNEEK